MEERERRRGRSTDPDVHICCLMERRDCRALKLHSAFLSHYPGVHILEGFSLKIIRFSWSLAPHPRRGLPYRVIFRK